MGSVRDRQHRWDLKLAGESPCVWEALQELVGNLYPILEGSTGGPLGAGVVEKGDGIGLMKTHRGHKN